MKKSEYLKMGNTYIISDWNNFTLDGTTGEDLEIEVIEDGIHKDKE